MKENARFLLHLIRDQGLPITALALILGWMYYLDWVDRTIDYEEKQELRFTIQVLRKDVQGLNEALLQCHQEQIHEMQELAAETRQYLRENQ